MRINKNRFITACQQTLAVGVVVAFLAPAANVVSLDVVSPDPDGGASGAAVTTAAVPVASVEPQVTEYALDEASTASSGVDVHEHDEQHSTEQGEEHGDHAHGLAADVDPADVVEAETSAPVDGFGAVGVTWSGEEPVVNGELALQLRTRVGQEWSDWSEMPFSDEHAPDVDSPDARSARGGTEPVIVGNVDEVEVRAEGDGTLPADLSLSVVDPGSVKTRQEAPAITAPATSGAGEGDIALSSKSVTAPRPTIYSRAQWGADEKLRDKASLRYGTISAGFVHHTVNANNYTEAEVPGIIRSIYAYHVKSRGWSDVGYNFLVDRFGRIWEGRAGGVDKAVVGAHTLGYNEYSFAMSAIGNFETAAPSQAMVNAYGSLMAWKLGLHGVNASARKQKVGKGTFHAINGHRDAGSTACPGKNLYAKIGEIRTRATALQGSATTPDPEAPATTPEPEPGPQFSAPKLQSNLVGSAHPDVLVRRASDKKLFAIPTGGLSELAAPKTLYKGWSTTTRGFVSPDLTGDGRADLVSVMADGTTKVRAGTGKGTFKAKAVSTHRGTKKHSLLVAAGDVNGDKRNDLVGRDAKGQAVAFLRTPGGKFVKVKLNRSWKTVASLHPVGDITGDGYPDLLARRKKTGKLLLIPSNGPRSFKAARSMAGSWNGLRDIVGGVDFDRDGNTDVVFRNTNGSVWVLPGLGNGTFEPVLGPIVTNKTVTALSIAPIHGNAFPDILARSGKSVVVMKNTGKYEIGQAVSLKIQMPTARAVLNGGDWNRDGKGDILAVRDNGDLLVRTGDGMGGLSKATVIGTGFHGVANLQAVGDVSGDGFPDLVGTHGGVTKVFRGQGLKKVLAGEAAPGFKAPLARLKTTSGYDATQYDWKISVSDVRLAAGTTDLVVRERSTGRLHVFENTTTGIGSRRYLGRGLGVYDLAG